MLFSSQDDESSIIHSSNSYHLTINKENEFNDKIIMNTAVKSSNRNQEIMYSPVKKRSRRSNPIFKLFGQSSIDNSNCISKYPKSNGIAMLNFSQDSNSQFSQDFVDRVNELSVGSSQDLNHQNTTHGLLFSEEGFLDPQYSNEAFSIPFSTIKFVNSQENEYASQTSNIPSNNISMFSTPGILKNECKESQKLLSVTDMRLEIPLSIPLTNPFINNELSETHGPKSIWTSAFSERPRLLTDYEVIHTLGEGHFSVVLKVKHRLDGLIYAIKKIKKSIANNKEKQLILREVHALAYLSNSCPNIVKYYTSWIDDNILYIQTEICELGNLDEWFVIQNVNMIVNEKNHSDSITSYSESTQKTEIINDYKKTRNNSTIDLSYFINEKLVWFLMMKISETLQYMHSNDIVHLDIRPGNIFISYNKESKIDTTNYNITYDDISNGILTNKYTVKVGDFGHCCFCNTNELITEGETRYCPSELISSLTETNCDLKKCDMFSLGISLYELCIGRILGSDSNDSNEWHDIREGKLSNKFYDNYSNSLTSVLDKLMNADPSNRPSASDIFDESMKFYNEINNNLNKTCSTPTHKNINVSIYDIIGKSIETSSPSTNTINLLMNQINNLNNQIKELKSK